MKNDMKKAFFSGIKTGVMINLGLILFIDGIRQYLK